MQVEGMVLSTKDKKTCACLTPPEASADKENCCSSEACTVAEVQALYQLPAGQHHMLAWCSFACGLQTVQFAQTVFRDKQNLCLIAA